MTSIIKTELTFQRLSGVLKIALIIPLKKMPGGIYTPDVLANVSITVEWLSTGPNTTLNRTSGS